MSETNWKAKYQKIRSQLMESVDASYRIGLEDGMKMAQQQQAQQTQDDQAAQDQAAAGGQPGQEGGDGPDGEGAQGAAPGQSMQESENPDGSELDQHLAKLEQMIAKSEKTEADLEEMKKSTAAIQTIRTKMKAREQDKLAKSAIEAIAKSLNRKPGLLGQNAQTLLKAPAKAALSMQERTINEMMKTWGEEEERAKKDILSVLSGEGITKKD